jgi:hypothetical protein
MRKEKFHELINACRDAAEWSFLPGGAFGYEIAQNIEGRYDILFFPAVHELHGGPEDGKKYYFEFTFKISDITKLFDNIPDIVYDTGKDVVTMFGNALDMNVRLSICREAPKNIEATYLVDYMTGVVTKINK